jgi:hypothetical protein
MANEFNDLFEKLVPEFGQSNTVQGELIRAIGRMAHEYFGNGFCNWDAGYERLAAFALRHLTDATFGPQTIAGIRADIEHIQAYGRRQNTAGYDLDAAFDRLMQAAVGWCQRHPSPMPHSPDPELKR